MFNSIELFSSTPIQRSVFSGEEKLDFKIEPIESKKADKTPVGGVCNTFLNVLVEQGKLSDLDYRLSKEVELKSVLSLEEIQEKNILAIFDQTMELKLSNGAACHFVVKDLFVDLLKVKSEKIEKILLVGGVLKKIISCSKLFCEKFLQSLGVKEVEKLSVLLDLLLEHLRKIPIQDGDVKIILKNCDPKEISLHIRSFITSRFTVFVSQYAINKELFSKFAAPPIKEKEVQIVQQHACSLTVKRQRTTKKLFYAVITPNGTVPFLEEKIPIQIEFLCVASLIRPYLGVRDALELDVSRIFNKKNEKETLQIQSSECALTTTQAIIDILGGIIRLPNPETIDEMGTLSTLSGFLKGLATVEPETIVNNLFDSYVSSRTAKETIYPNNLKTTFSSCLGINMNDILKDINRCLDNHHKEDPTAKVLWMFHFFQAFRNKMKPEVLLDLFKSITDGIKTKEKTAVNLIHTALCELKMPFELIESILQLGVLFVIDKIDIEDLNAAISFRRHCGKIFLQVRMEDTISSHIFVPLPTKASFENVKNFLSEKKISKNERKVIIGLFDLLCSKRTKKGNGRSLFAANQILFDGAKGLYSLESDEFLNSSSPILQYIGFQLSLCLQVENLSVLLKEFPSIWMKKRTKAEKILLFQDLQNALSKTSFRKMGEWKAEENLMDPEVRIEVLWPLMLSKIDDPKCVPVVAMLVQNALELHLNEKEQIIVLEIISTQMQIDALTAQTLWLCCQKKIFQSNNVLIQETALIKKMWKWVKDSQKEPKGLQLLSHMTCILENFVERMKGQNISESIDADFQDLCLSFIELAFMKFTFEEAHNLFSRFTEHLLLPAGNERIAELWACVSYAEGKIDFKMWESTKQRFFAFAIISQIDQEFKSFEEKKGYKLLKSFLKNSTLSLEVEAELSRVLLRWLRSGKKSFEDLSTLLGMALSEKLLHEIVKCLTPDILKGALPFAKMAPSKGYSILISHLKEQLITADFITFEGFDRSLTRFLVIEERILVDNPEKQIVRGVDLIIATLADDPSLSRKESMQAAESVLKLILNALPSDSKEKLFEKPISGLLNRLCLLENPRLLGVFATLLEDKKIVSQLGEKDLYRYQVIYHIFCARTKYGNRYLEASKYLIGKRDLVKDDPAKWIETLTDLITSYPCHLPLRGESLQEEKKVYVHFDRLRQKLFEHIEQMDKQNITKYRLCFLDALLQKTASKNIHMAEICEWVDKEVASLVKIDCSGYRVIEKYIFWIVGYRTDSYYKRVQQADLVVKEIAKTDFYKKNPQEWIKTQMYLRKSYEGASGEILFELLKNILANNSQYALNAAVEILFAYQTRIEGDDPLLQLKKCYELLFDIAEKDPCIEVALKMDRERAFSFFQAIGAIFTYHKALLIRAYSPRNVIPVSSNNIVRYVGGTANYAINAFQYIKDSCCASFEIVSGLQLFPAKKGSFILTKTVFTKLFRIALAQREDVVAKRWNFYQWLNGITKCAADSGVFLGEQGHQRYYEVVEKILNRWIESMEFFKEKDLRSPIESLYHLIAGKEDCNTFFGKSPIYRDLCSPYSKEIRVKRRQLFDLFFQNIWKKCGSEYLSWTKTWYLYAQKQGFYGKKREKKPLKFS